MQHSFTRRYTPLLDKRDAHVGDRNVVMIFVIRQLAPVWDGSNRHSVKCDVSKLWTGAQTGCAFCNRSIPSRISLHSGVVEAVLTYVELEPASGRKAIVFGARKAESLTAPGFQYCQGRFVIDMLYAMADCDQKVPGKPGLSTSCRAIHLRFARLCARYSFTHHSTTLFYVINFVRVLAARWK